ncbi:MAG TPA: CPBP family intramembrane glutamic endopeptidase [Vicinamibacterales bacterium]|jgi:membrane protease YdiL (CAAX protease family)
MTNLAAGEGRATGRARKGLAIYFAIVVIGSAFLEWRILRTGEQIGANAQLVFALMWTPAIASVVARLALREGFRDVSFRWGGRAGTDACLLAWIFPLVVGFVAYGIAWTTGLAQFQSTRIAERLPTLPVPIGFLVSVVFSATIAALVGCLSAAGEEIGWRGYMLTRLIDSGVPKPVLVSGIIWGAWHTPLILSGQYASGSHPYVSAALFMVNIVAFAYLAAYVRLSSGSVWPAVLLHAAWNAIIQGPFDRNTVDTPMAVGESGYLTAAVTIAVVVWMIRGRMDAVTADRRPAA